MATISEQKYSWGEFYETTIGCDEYSEEQKKRFAVFEALDKATSMEEVRGIVKPLSQNEINWLNSPCLDGIIVSCSEIQTLYGKEYTETCKFYLFKKLVNINTLLCLVYRFSKIVKIILENSEFKHIDYHFFPMVCQSGRTETVKLLLESKTSLHNTEEESFVLACTRGHLSIVNLLLKYRPDIIHNLDSAYVFLTTCSKGYLEIVKIIVENGVDIHLDDDEALVRASTHGHTDIVKYLLENNVSNKRNKSLIYASDNGHVEVVKLLIEYGADIHAENDMALRWAFKEDRYAVIEFLLERGADISVITNRYPNFVKIAKLILSKLEQN